MIVKMFHCKVTANLCKYTSLPLNIALLRILFKEIQDGIDEWVMNHQLTPIYIPIITQLIDTHTIMY